ncbi:hypothetical protein LPJ59_003074 [Coemansia sp. RSA 2399]|nr:hypothetical protein LPJ59_003074 [Coemansia sp. RSA 2399]KAJ1904011.1 hypothetical protein LPJ81_002747 [Coemansia sp. IMI 209127]
MLAVAKRIESYLSTTDTAKAPVPWEVSVARHILQSCQTLFTKLDGVKIGVQNTSVLELCRSEWSAAESSVNSVLLALESHNTALRPDESKQLAQKCRQVVGALYACVTSLATCAGGLDSVDGHSLKVATKALHEVAVRVRQLQSEVRNAPERAASNMAVSSQQIPSRKDSLGCIVTEESQGAGTESGDPKHKHAKSGSESASDSLHSLPSVRTPTEAPGTLPKPKSKSHSKKKPRTGQHATDAQTRDAVRDAIVVASALAELLRIFTRVSQQSWVNTRTQLAHAPSVSSPLSSGSTMLRHRRWVSEEIESEASSPTPGLRISVDGRPMDADAGNRAVESAHMRNRSESRLRLNDAPHPGPALRKSALSLRSRSPTSQQPALPLSSGNNSDAGERSKQVRFVSTTSLGPQVDQGHLNELAQFLLQFEKSVSALQCALRDDATADSSYASEIRGLVTAFVQISKLSSNTGMVKHYDKPTLAQFKTTTQAIKQLTPLLLKSS